LEEGGREEEDREEEKGFLFSSVVDV